MMTRASLAGALLTALYAGAAFGQSALPNVTQACADLKAAKTVDAVKAVQRTHDKSAEITSTRQSINGSDLQKRAQAYLAANATHFKARNEWQTLVQKPESEFDEDIRKAQAEVNILNSDKGRLDEINRQLADPQLSGTKPDEQKALEAERKRLIPKVAGLAAAQQKLKGAEQDLQKKRDATGQGLKEIKRLEGLADTAKADFDKENDRIKGLVQKVAALEAFQGELKGCAAQAENAIKAAAASPSTAPPPKPAAPPTPTAPSITPGAAPSISPTPAALNVTVPESGPICAQIDAAKTSAEVDAIYNRQHGAVTPELTRARQALADNQREAKSLEKAAKTASDAHLEARTQLNLAKQASPVDPQKIATLDQEVKRLRAAADSAVTLGAQLAYREAQLKAKVKRWEDLDKAVLDCATKRKAALTGPTFDELLAAIEANLTELEAMARLVPGSCAEIQNGANQASLNADRLAAELDVLASQANVAAKGGAGVAAGPGQKALNDAGAAAAGVAQSRNRARQHMQAACAAGQQVVLNPKNPGAAAQLAEALRNRALAEQEVTLSANALQQIRAAHAAAAAAATPGTNPADFKGRLDTLSARYSGLASVPPGLKSRANDIGRFFQRVTEASNALKRLTSAPADSDLGRYAAKHAGRVGAAAAREARLRATTDCSAAALTAITNLETRLTAVHSKLTQASNAVAAARSIGGTAAYQQAIETQYNTARSIADGTAADATTAIDCAAKAQRAMAAAPPTAATPPAPKPPAPPATPGMMQDFNGTWKPQKDPYGPIVWTISGEGLGAKVSVKTQSRLEVYEWSATCRPEGTNVQNCTGQGIYHIGNRRQSYAIALKMTMESGSIRFEYVYSNVQGEESQVNYTVPGGTPKNGKKVAGQLARPPR